MASASVVAERHCMALLLKALPATTTPAEVAGSISRTGLCPWLTYRRQGLKITRKPASDDWAQWAEQLLDRER
jgi:hypothetical protein